jgi:DNA-binding transcriptional regulator GbsR (MarR family)
MGKKRAKELKALMYLECTAKSPDTVNQAFFQIISSLMTKDRERAAKVEKLYHKELKQEQKNEKKLEKEKRKQSLKNKSKENNAATSTTASAPSPSSSSSALPSGSQ